MSKSWWVLSLSLSIFNVDRAVERIGEAEIEERRNGRRTRSLQALVSLISFRFFENVG